MYHNYYIIILQNYTTKTRHILQILYRYRSMQMNIQMEFALSLDLSTVIMVERGWFQSAGSTHVGMALSEDGKFCVANYLPGGNVTPR